MNLTETLEFIHSTDWKGSCLGLERMEELMSRLGNPQDGLRFVHVAGTNGKGSTCAMLSSILTEAGYKTGLYTSPHLVRVNERIKLNGIDIPDEDLVSLAEKVKLAADAMEDRPTEFEILTAMAFLYYKEQRCDIVVLEVGLGGRLDATNIIRSPEVAVICNIGLEHTEVLGDTLEKIAAEKAGIIKNGCTAVIYRGVPEVERVYERICAQKNVSLKKAHFEAATIHQQSLSGQSFDWMQFTDLNIKLLGGHQIRNAVVALETLLVLRQMGWEIPDAAVRNGLCHISWPARFEILNEEPIFIADGAHNPQCVEILVQSINEFLSGKQIVFLLGVLADKNYDQMLARLMPLAKAFLCLTPDNNRALPAEWLAEHLRELGQDAEACGTVENGIRQALFKAAGAPIIACGSLYMMGEVQQQFSQALRKWQRKDRIHARESISFKERAVYNHAIAQRIADSSEYKTAHTILSYMALCGEADLRELNELAARQGKHIIYPYCISTTEMIALSPRGPESWSVGHYGILEPIPEKSDVVSPADIDLVLCPCTAFDSAGNRMGMGAGYYDRYLEKCVGVVTAAVAFECQKLPRVSVAPWDKPMQKIFTEATTYPSC